MFVLGRSLAASTAEAAHQCRLLFPSNAAYQRPPERVVLNVWMAQHTWIIMHWVLDIHQTKALSHCNAPASVLLPYTSKP